MRLYLLKWASAIVSSEMNLKAVLCVPLGHKWGEAPDVVETYPVLRCKRCGRPVK
jgi:hypothetical protein